MKAPERYTLKIVGESGQGISSIGKLTHSALINEGFYVFGYREYPSLIKGGHASFQIDISNVAINSASNKCDLMMVLSRLSFNKYLETIQKNGTIIHLVDSLILNQSQKAFITANNIKLHYINAHKLSTEVGGSYLTSNMVILGSTWTLLGMSNSTLLKAVEKEFADKPKFLEIDKKCINAGIEHVHSMPLLNFTVSKPSRNESKRVSTGNAAIVQGAIDAKCRAFYAYPMTPASSILTILAQRAMETKMIVKQAEDEITAAQMSLGSMFMGARSFTATSGGGFDLMTETVTLAAMTETPFVCVLASRPGPATGLPTWTSASDLNLAIYSGHGEFPKCVMAASDLESCYRLIQEAFNYSEYFQIPVILLTEKHIAESLYQFENYPEKLPIIRNLVEGKALDSLKQEDRYAFTQNGISKRWLPGSSQAAFLANGDEHNPDGSVSEDSLNASKMYEKRMLKLKEIVKMMPKAKVFGNKESKNVIIGWGSTKVVVLDAINEGGFDNWAYVHFEYIYPFKKEGLEFLTEADTIISIENNYLSQLSQLFENEMNLELDGKYTKYDGRPYFVDEIIDILKRHK